MFRLQHQCRAASHIIYKNDKYLRLICSNEVCLVKFLNKERAALRSQMVGSVLLELAKYLNL